MFETELLRSFVTVADLTSFTRAAECLHSTQSTISAQIRRLEEQAGQTLFTRSTRQVQLTRAGEVLLGYARTILRLNEDARARLSGTRHAGQVRLGVSEDLAAVWLPQVLAQHATWHPNVQVDLHVGFGEQLLDMLDEKELDVVVAGLCDEQAGGSRLWSEPLVWAFSGNATLPVPAPLAFFQEPCPYRDAALRSLAGTPAKWRIACTSTSLAGLRAAALAGLAATPLPRSIVGPGLRAIETDEGLPALPDVVYAVWLGSKKQAAAGLVRIIETGPGPAKG
ncbi:LysR substrate-binding domain-containing protein [Pendulispora albinea]|uniref:LysR substrate-binding domain-containing protein n=1 Tax=Pendulispora albinea TaxID=2741071 RepID=A0ABZ2LWN8_9BACT